ncbi:TetR/AcrR family transcriptional regulator [Variovorax ginsengisoli]|uniref:AcrR family transcriptional regulator n=1 Tax=Variovorax ginsengisoli TaxID=363844 RepID=A0ABT9SE19_9BURK|nr:TetR/AcrR family transcriptional regulator [Variovorax ginsengisoli]MDP9902594.1 AcrR family transcriptional regulator [Variovorax ginsengisoli]
MRVRTEAKRDAIVEAAAEVFLQAGFEGASMAEIAVRVGGSKATLYGYFSSKEDLFLEVIQYIGRRHFDPIFDSLAQHSGDLRTALQRFGEKMMQLLTDEPIVRAQRAVIAESGRTDIGQRFFRIGPQKGLDDMARFVELQMARGHMRQADPMLAAQQLFALFEVETRMPLLFGLARKVSKPRVRQAVELAVDAFLRIYAPNPPATAPAALPA